MIAAGAVTAGKKGHSNKSTIFHTKLAHLINLKWKQIVMFSLELIITREKLWICNRSFGGAFGGACYKCGRPGHRALDCPGN